ncbi:MAG: ABC transporter permease [Chitinophagaceae bacterium]|nr:ABC transporter permease [Chitinophagaceae bacterium]MBN8667654.1 ABC transporter permease [Chitinophagales bacterium]
MLRTIEIILSSFKMAALELWKNKLRTFLSLFGVTIGIFCIIGVMATLGSLEKNIQNEIQSFGTNTIYLDKWDYSQGGGPDYPWWKFIKRPLPKYDEVKQIKDRTHTASHAAFMINSNANLEYSDNILSNVILYGFSEEFDDIQPIEVRYGRYFSASEFERGSNAGLIGNEVAEQLFVNPERAVGKQIIAKGKKITVIGVIKKQGNQMLGGWQFDQSLVMPYKFARNIMNERNASPLIMVQGKENIPSTALKEDLRGSMRAIHKLKPTQEDDFSLNDVNDWSTAFSEAFSGINLGGAIIGGISLIVGLFGVANIMFVTVKERTSQIGLKKALGAKSRIILTEFLLEAAFLCLVGGAIGLLLVFGLTKILTNVFNFPIYLSTSNMIVAVVICFVIGILAGIIPASQASRMDPVVAIRSK